MKGTFQKLASRNSPFFICSQEALYKKINLWKSHFPSVTPHYAVKSNPDKQLLKWMNDSGLGFDCASSGEISDVLNISNKIIFANPTKNPSDILFALKSGIKQTTFDSDYELKKLVKLGWKDGLILRVKVDESGSNQPFSSKFGAPPEWIPNILKVASKLGILLDGLSFHIGSDCKNSTTHANALLYCYNLIQNSQTSFKKDKLTIDIGGGFLGDNDKLFSETSFHIYRNKLFKVAGRDINYIAEPGRFFCTSPFQLYVPVIAKRKRLDGVPGFAYTINESIYSSFSGIPFDGFKPKFEVCSNNNSKTYKSIIFGRTCDSQDIIAKNIDIPELNVGDYLRVPNIGAYSSSSSSTFNGFEKTPTYYVGRTPPLIEV
jgi:ornithine decarboxylase